MENFPNIVLLIAPWSSGRIRERDLLRQLFHDLSRERIRVLPLPPPWFSEDTPRSWQKWESWWRFDFEDWDYLLDRRFRYQHEWRHDYPEWRHEIRHMLRRLADRDEKRAVVILTHFDEERGHDLEELHDFVQTLDPAVIVHLNIGKARRYTDLFITKTRTLNYPDDYLELIHYLRGFTDFAAHPKPCADSFTRHEPSAEIAPIDRLVTMPDEVHIGISTPRVVSPGETFVVRFAAYTDSNRNEILQKLELEAPMSQQRLGLENCRWHRNTKVTVQLEVNHARVSNPIQTFLWNGAWKILRFDVVVLDHIVTKTLILKLDVAVEGLPIMAIRPEIEVLNAQGPRIGTLKSSFVERAAPKSAFASYAKGDRREVLGRVRSLQIFTGIDVFFDCLSLQPGDEWKPKLSAEIGNREIFWLFWSRRAIDSEWVNWEWRTALALKSLSGIQPHPLEPMEIAPPPKELSELQFGTMYEWYISQLRESWPTSHSRILCHRAASLFQKLSRWWGQPRRLGCFTILILFVIPCIPISIAIINWLGYLLHPM